MGTFSGKKRIKEEGLMVRQANLCCVISPERLRHPVQVYFGGVEEEPRKLKGYDSSGSDCKPEVWTGR